MSNAITAALAEMRKNAKDRATFLNDLRERHAKAIDGCKASDAAVYKAEAAAADNAAASSLLGRSVSKSSDDVAGVLAARAKRDGEEVLAKTLESTIKDVEEEIANEEKARRWSCFEALRAKRLKHLQTAFAFMAAGARLIQDYHGNLGEAQTLPFVLGRKVDPRPLGVDCQTMGDLIGGNAARDHMEQIADITNQLPVELIDRAERDLLAMINKAG